MSKLAILGGTPVRQEALPSWPVFDARDSAAVAAVVESGNWGGYPYPGPQTAEFTRRFVEMQGGKYAVAMANGTITMEVALRAAEIGWGDEVIVPAYTFMATAAAPMAAGAIPVIADVDPETYCLDPVSFEKAITPRTRAVILVHLGAQMTDMDAVIAIAEKHDLVVIEDCAHAHGAQWNGRGAGTFGHFGSFSLQSSKILTTGEGGILLCRTEELAAKAMSIIDCGRPHDTQKQVYTMGSNYRMTELQSALGIVALERFPEQMRQRETMLGYLEESLSELPGLRLLRRDLRHTRRSFYRYILAVDPDVFGAEHDVVCAALDAEGISCWKGYDAMHHYDLFQPQNSKQAVPNAFPEYFQFEGMEFPAAEKACEHEAVWLDESIFRGGTQAVDDTVAAFKKLLAHKSDLERIAGEKKQIT